MNALVLQLAWPWHLYEMVTQNMLLTYDGNIRFLITLDRIKCLKHIKITEISSYMRTYY